MQVKKKNLKLTKLIRHQQTNNKTDPIGSKGKRVMFIELQTILRAQNNKFTAQLEIFGIYIQLMIA